MDNQWRDDDASRYVTEFGERSGPDLALRTYSSRLLGSQSSLVLHGGGNTSVKTTGRSILGEETELIFVKASGFNMATIPTEGHSGLDLAYLRKLRCLSSLTDDEMVNQLRTHLVDAAAATPSIEAFMHAFIPARFIDHTHPDVILALTNRPEGEHTVREALGPSVGIVPYVKAGFDLALAVARFVDQNPESDALVLMNHGLVTWADDPKTSYSRTIELVSRAQEFLGTRRATSVEVDGSELETARERYRRLAPVVRGALAIPTSNPDLPFDRFILKPLISGEVLQLLSTEKGRSLALTAPLTPDHLIRTKNYPLLLDEPDYEDTERLRSQLGDAIGGYARQYDEYFERNRPRLAPGLQKFDSHPRVVLLPGLGAVCAGEDAQAAQIVRDITEQTLGVKAWFAAEGAGYQGLDESHLFDMEYFTLQHAKLARRAGKGQLGRQVALVTGAAGAIGVGVCEKLLLEGCHVAVSDLPGEHLTGALKELEVRFPGHAIAVPIDVTDAGSISRGFGQVIETWGGLDIVVVNAGIAHVSPLVDMDLEVFRKLERVNIEGTLLVLAEAGRRFRLQKTQGDIVVVSTKNVFAPGAKFGAYSATKAASHQLARIASLELAELGVRVNMVAPDAVFSHGSRKSGLWAEVGPDRMRARGLDEKGLEEYYRSRNLLKAKVTAEHVGRAALFFLTRQTPTTGATIPVDGGLPDSTPR